MLVRTSGSERIYAVFVGNNWRHHHNMRVRIAPPVLFRLLLRPRQRSASLGGLWE